MQPNSPPRRPTAEVSTECQFFFSYFNERLFDKALPEYIITYTRHPLTQGYFCAEAFRDRDGRIANEIAMHPAYFHMGDTESFQTFVHEMTHLWRHLHGKRNRKPPSISKPERPTIKDTSDVIGKTAREAEPWLR